MVECSDGTLYTGSTNNLHRRIREHNEGKNGARYTKMRRPVKLVYSEKCVDMSEARRREAEIKGKTREWKCRLVEKFL